MFLFYLLFLNYLIGLNSFTYVDTITGNSIGYLNGIGTNALFYKPMDIACSPNGIYALITDYFNHRIRMLILSTNEVLTIAGHSSYGSNNGIGTNAKFYNPWGIDISPDSSFALISDYSNNQIKKLIISTKEVSLFAGSKKMIASRANGYGTRAGFNKPAGLKISPDGTYVIVADQYNNQIRKILMSRLSSLIAGSKKGALGSKDAKGGKSRFFYPTDIEISPFNNYALIIDSNNHKIRKLILSTLVVTTLVGKFSGSTNGIGTSALFNFPNSISFSLDYSYALISDQNNNQIRKLIISTKEVTLFAGSPSTLSGNKDGIGTTATFFYPAGLSLSSDAYYILVSDSNNNLIRKVIISSTVSPTFLPSSPPTRSPTFLPTFLPSSHPTTNPTTTPTKIPTFFPSKLPTFSPSFSPSSRPTFLPSSIPTHEPTYSPSSIPTLKPTFSPSTNPTFSPSSLPTIIPSYFPSTLPTFSPTSSPTPKPTFLPSSIPTTAPSNTPTGQPTSEPTNPTGTPTSQPTSPTSIPTSQPTNQPTLAKFKQLSKSQLGIHFTPAPFVIPPLILILVIFSLIAIKLDFILFTISFLPALSLTLNLIYVTTTDFYNIYLMYATCIFIFLMPILYVPYKVIKKNIYIPSIIVWVKATWVLSMENQKLYYKGEISFNYKLNGPIIIIYWIYVFFAYMFQTLFSLIMAVLYILVLLIWFILGVLFIQLRILTIKYFDDKWSNFFFQILNEQNHHVLGDAGLVDSPRLFILFGVLIELGLQILNNLFLEKWSYIAFISSSCSGLLLLLWFLQYVYYVGYLGYMPDRVPEILKLVANND